ncbi:hypothetical protein CVV68_17095 [Arthrobacter livingstonensis]|uniref:Uncharacterized protein n=1 Tax=Arthrobacter livingstonensis TaxID=670078 RepID=A0A2V5L3B1_9MICC|nr:hypothetical protein [Arthrobacter livingstonensis]PYI65759.1 hypothetical protein CVV68_17095 [Arthrobacter livingstonensis]
MLLEFQVVMLCGLNPQNGWRRYVGPQIDNDKFTVINTWHPSPSALKQDGKGNALRVALAHAVKIAAAPELVKDSRGSVGRQWQNKTDRPRMKSTLPCLPGTLEYFPTS